MTLLHITWFSESFLTLSINYHKSQFVLVSTEKFFLDKFSPSRFILLKNKWNKSLPTGSISLVHRDTKWHKNPYASYHSVNAPQKSKMKNHFSWTNTESLFDNPMTLDEIRLIFYWPAFHSYEHRMATLLARFSFRSTVSFGHPVRPRRVHFSPLIERKKKKEKEKGRGVFS